MGAINTAITTLYLFVTGGAMFVNTAIGQVLNTIGSGAMILQDYVANVFGL
ncbi:MAG: hypothetical protein FWG67_01570 [Defluviitaleaceae bacterium]|nr:hypothetical protein [Defluviitaleaceae bacterium]